MNWKGLGGEIRL